eukprot:TRINITY_DN40623_c0_g1_i1.p1 TRINITY_DN40623_c0_g1~~TRINITY_DN40623_c0_g1_i1.p1  ORF type:complete len:495 (+),score=107.26 TRINITY_DN40623_c0_g1_i1:28-1512(+)
MSAFASLGVAYWLCGVLDKLKLVTPTPIQAAAIPPILAGKDVCGCAVTGSGKTAAFALPIVQRLTEDPYGVYCVVLSPTRELALQTAYQFSTFGSRVRLDYSLLVGGLDYVKQVKKLDSRPHLVIGTPGRLAAILMREHYRVLFSKVKFLVVDEADRLVGEQFDIVASVCALLPKKRQTLFFSATMLPQLQDSKSQVVRQLTTNPYVTCDTQAIGVEANKPKTVTELGKTKKGKAEAVGRSLTAAGLTERYVFLPERNKVRMSYLAYLLQPDKFPARSVIVFVNTCKTCELVRLTLQHLGHQAKAISSYSPQMQRFRALHQFKLGAARILVATDVASRGLDIPIVDLVLNFELSPETVDYVHRVGRTARAGRTGLAVTLVSPKDVSKLHEIEAAIGHQLDKQEGIVEDEVVDMLDDVTRAMIEAETNFQDQFGEEVDPVTGRKRRDDSVYEDLKATLQEQVALETKRKKKKSSEASEAKPAKKLRRKVSRKAQE